MSANPSSCRSNQSSIRLRIIHNRLILIKINLFIWRIRFLLPVVTIIDFLLLYVIFNGERNHDAMMNLCYFTMTDISDIIYCIILWFSISDIESIVIVGVPLTQSPTINIATK